MRASRIITMSFVAVAVVITTSGCGKQLEEFVRVNRPKSPLLTDLSAAGSIKISPGQTSAVGGDVAMTAHVTITDRPLDGGDVSARVSVSRQRQE